MPSIEQMRELLDNCQSESAIENDIYGYRITASNGAHVFLPVARKTGRAEYWLSSIFADQPDLGGFLFNYDGNFDIGGYYRYEGYMVRPVTKASSIPSGVAVNIDKFPDENFRNWVLAQDYGQDGVLTDEEIAAITSIEIPRMNIADLKGIEHFTALTVLNCVINNLSKLNVSKNLALTELYSSNNQLSSIDVSGNTELKALFCDNNQLTSIDVTNNTALVSLVCFNNQINEIEMGKLVRGLPSTNSGDFFVKNTNNVNDQNVITTSQVAEAKSKGWTVFATDGSDWIEYEGSMPEGIAIDETNFPDEKFRNWVLAQDYGKDGVLTDTEIAAVKSMYIFLNTGFISDLKGVEYFTALTSLSCGGNRLTSLDVSKNTALEELICYQNNLTELDLSNNPSLKTLNIQHNQIKGTAMDALIESLPETSNGYLLVMGFFDEYEQNVITKAQVAAAKEKGWKVYSVDSNGSVEYPGSDPEMATVDEGESIDISTDIDEGTNLDGNVVGDVYYSISSGDGSYNATEGCIVVTKPTDDNAIDGQDIFGEDFNDHFTGIVFKVAAGTGTVNVEAEATGNMVLKVKIGDGAPTEMVLDGKVKASFPYNVSEDTYVYIYAGTKAAGAKGMRKAGGSGELKIYGIEVVSGEDGIEYNNREPITNNRYYNLNGQRVNEPTKGVFIKNGKKVLVK